MKRLFFIIAIIATLSYFNDLHAQGSAGEKAFFESRNIVISPNAGLLDKNTYTLYSSAFHSGGALLDFVTAPFTNFNIGLSYSCTNLIGSGSLNFQNLPGLNIKVRFLNETNSIPALVIGFSNQGHGTFNSKDKRFEIMSPGFYLAGSKNYRWLLGTVSFHSAFTYSLEPLPKKRNPNLVIGLEQSLGSILSLNLEYNSNFDESNDKYIKSKGLFNAALRCSIAKNLTVEFQAIDCSEHLQGFNGFNRVICLEYINKF
jgi:hypothetical protein